MSEQSDQMQDSRPPLKNVTNVGLPNPQKRQAVLSDFYRAASKQNSGKRPYYDKGPRENDGELVVARAPKRPQVSAEPDIRDTVVAPPGAPSYEYLVYAAERELQTCTIETPDADSDSEAGEATIAVTPCNDRFVGFHYDSPKSWRYRASCARASSDVNLLQLGEDIIGLISQHMSFGDILRMERTCTTMHHYMQNRSLWQVLCQKHFSVHDYHLPHLIPEPPRGLNGWRELYQALYYQKTILPSVEFHEGTMMEPGAYVALSLDEMRSREEPPIHKNRRSEVQHTKADGAFNLKQPRFILADWLGEVVDEIVLGSRSAHLGVAIMDYCLTSLNMTISLPNLQLVGVVSLMIASKYVWDNVNILTPRDIEQLCAHAYTPAEALAMELKILELMDYHLEFPTRVDFVGQFALLLQPPRQALVLATYFCDLTLLDFHFSEYLPSQVAACALYCALRFYGFDWNDHRVSVTGFDENTLLTSGIVHRLAEVHVLVYEKMLESPLNPSPICLVRYMGSRNFHCATLRPFIHRFLGESNP